MMISLKQKIIGFNVCLITALLLIAGIIIMPAITQINQLKNDINNIQNQMEERYREAKKMRRSLQELNDLKQTLIPIKQSLLKPGDELAIITELEKIASQNQLTQNLNLNLIDATKNPDPNNPARALPIYYQFSFLNNGSFQNQLNFLKALEQLPYYVIIDSLDLEKTTNNSSGPMVLNAHLDTVIYVDKN